MASRVSRFVARPALAVSLALAAVVAQAQPAPPIKPGLWEMKMARETDGKQAPDMSERMKNMSPEMRARMDAMMKQRGVSMEGGTTTVKICLTKESLSKDGWREGGEGCKTDVSGQGTSTWKWHSVCPNSVSDGEAKFSGGDAYTMTNTMVMTRDGQQHVTKMSGAAKRLGDDCGDLKPMQRR
jgi:hypothetical protein